MTAQRGQPTGRRLTPLLLLLLLILLGYWLRVHNLDTFSFWTDEGLTPERSGYSIAQILRNEIVIQGIVTKDTHPPLYYLIIHVTRKVFGLSDFAFRYPSVLFGVLLIPLLYQLGRRLPSRRERDVASSPGGRELGRGAGAGLGLIVALLAAVNPLQVYYSQEARMYTLLALLATGMSYVLWRAIEEDLTQRAQSAQRTPKENASLRTWRTSRSLREVIFRWLLLYVVLAGLAVYTHYTAAFLVAAQALFWAWLLWRAGLRWVIVGALALGVLIAIPLIPYTVPRLLAGAEANYYAVSPLTMLLDVVRFFHLGLTVDFDQAFIQALNWLAFGLLALGVWAARPWRKRLFLLSWLLAVPLGLMLGSALFKPMYQGVRHIMAGSPAFLLLVGGGVWAIWNWLPRRRRENGEEPAGELTGWTAWVADAPRANPLALVPLILLLLGAAVALVNLYTDPAYAKDDFRAIVRFIETRAGNRDVIVYNNAVLLPLHEHYRLRPDIAVTALPAYPQIATGQEPELAALAGDYDRVWFVTDPPADGRDDDGLIHAWLDANLLEVSDRSFAARTTEARVVGYATPADGRPPTAVRGEWEGLPALTGVRIGTPDPLTLPTLWVDLWWQGERPDGAQLVFTLTGPDGAEWYSRGHPLSREGSTWDSAAPNRRSYDLPLPPGLPPGTYALAVAPQGGDPQPLCDVTIAATDTWPVSPELLFADTDLAVVRGLSSAVSWPVGLALAAVEPWDDAVLPGNNLPLTLFWRVGPDGVDLTNVRYRLEVIDRGGTVLRAQEARPGAAWLGRVAPGALLREVAALYFRPETEPGTYRLRWTLLDGDAVIGEPVTQGRIVVEPWPLVTTPPAAQTNVDAEFGPAIQLFGYDRGEIAGGELPLTLYWRATAAPAASYLVFIHLVDEAGNVVSQIDTLPMGGARPTSGWRAGEFITDAYVLPIPTELPPGPYRINVGLYNPDDGARLAVTVGGAPQPDNQLQLATLELPGGEP